MDVPGTLCVGRVHRQRLGAGYGNGGLLAIGDDVRRPAAVAALGRAAGAQRAAEAIEVDPQICRDCRAPDDYPLPTAKLPASRLRSGIGYALLRCADSRADATVVAGDVRLACREAVLTARAGTQPSQGQYRARWLDHRESVIVGVPAAGRRAGACALGRLSSARATRRPPRRTACRSALPHGSSRAARLAAATGLWVAARAVTRARR